MTQCISVACLGDDVCTLFCLFLIKHGGDGPGTELVEALCDLTDVGRSRLRVLPLFARNFALLDVIVALAV